MAGPRLLIPSIHMRSPTPRFGLVWCTGQAWIRILDLVRDQLEHTIDLSLLCQRPYRGWTRRGWCVSGADKRTSSWPSCHAACASGADRSTSAILPHCMLELGARIRHHRLVTSHIRAFDTFPLVPEAPPSTPCLVCMLSRPKAYLARATYETHICSSLVKSGL